MAYKKVPYEKRIKENIKNYHLQNLYDMNMLQEYLKSFAQTLQIELLLTERHGGKAVSVGGFAGFTPDVVNEPGHKIRIQNRTIGHLYVKTEAVEAGKKAQVEALIERTVEMLASLGSNTYYQLESAAYLDELEAQVISEHNRIQHGEREDALTGVFNKIYFENRMCVIDRAEVAPVAVINANINDWKFVNDHFGDEESDRLICEVASILKKEAKQDYIIGRTDGDVFHIIIPMPQDGEVEQYCQSVTQSCEAFEDAILAPSVAIGYVYKTNVEEKLKDLLSDAEYEMFNRKFEMKNAPGYRERLAKGIKA